MTEFDWHPWQFVLIFSLFFGLFAIWQKLASSSGWTEQSLEPQHQWKGFLHLLVILIPLVTLITYLFNFPLSHKPAIRFLESHGYENVLITGYRAFSCNSELQRLEFKAELNTHSVKGVICGSIFTKYSIELK